MEAIQDLRANKTVPGGRPIHDYACLYFNGRNKMMFSRLSQHEELCVLRVGIAVLDLTECPLSSFRASTFPAPSPGREWLLKCPLFR